MGRVILVIVICIILFALYKIIAWVVNAARKINQFNDLKDKVTYLERDTNGMDERVRKLRSDVDNIRMELDTVQDDLWKLENPDEDKKVKPRKTKKNA